MATTRSAVEHATPPHLGSGGSRRRVLALAAAETRLLLRNRTAVLSSVVLPLALVAAVGALTTSTGGTVDGPGLVANAIAVTLTFVTFYNLVTTFVARREELVLQRMRTGELTDAEVLLGTAAPTLLVTVVQVVLVAVGVVALGEWSAPVDVVLPLVALVGGGASVVALAAVSTSFTRTVEAAQFTTMPLVLTATMLSGLLIPLSDFPAQLAWVARLLPLTPVVELSWLGLVGRTWDGQAVDTAGAWAASALPLAVLAGWLVGGAVLARSVFRWAPRR